MGKTVKVAISLPEGVLAAVEDEIRSSGESRSQFFRRAVQTFFELQRERALSEQYVRGYTEMPETDEEVEAARLAASTVLAEEAWE